MTGVGQAYVVGITLERSVVAYLKLSEGTPAHQMLGEFKRAVLHHLCIQATVGSVVNVFKEDTIHSRLYRCAELLGVHLHHVRLSRQSEGRNKCQKTD